MLIDPLTPEQELFAGSPDPVFLQACPGSGKTRTILERVRRVSHSLGPRQGIAVLSFTNAAVHEFMERVQRYTLDQSVSYPSFVGTVDAFIRHFIVMPQGISATSERPTILDSWNRVDPIQLLPPNRFSGAGPSLEKFDPVTNSIDVSSVRHPALRRHIQEHLVAYQEMAARRRAKLNAKGYFSASECRVHALEMLKKASTRESLGLALTHRFAELIVDEAQDCNPMDLQVLAWLRSQGLRITIVSDPDQAIYGFRSGSSATLHSFASSFGRKMYLSSNFRSSPAICAFAATLRSKAEPDKSVGETMNVACQVKVMAYSGVSVPKEIGTQFAKYLKSDGRSIPLSNAIVLAHTEKVAFAAAGVSLGINKGNGALTMLADAMVKYWSKTSNPRLRESALCAIEKLILELTGAWKPGDHATDRVIIREGINRRLLRRQVVDLVTLLPWPFGSTVEVYKEWVEHVPRSFESLQLTLPIGKSLKKSLPGSGKWMACFTQKDDNALQAATIHSSKGAEYDAVCVVIPMDRGEESFTEELFDAWRDRIDTESKRVIYVGVTRAKRFLMIAVPKPFASRYNSIMREAGLTCTLDSRALERKPRMVKKDNCGTGSLFKPDDFL